MQKMSENFYCAAHFHENGYCLARHANCHGSHCPNWHRKWPTPEEYKKEYGYEWPDDGAVYYLVAGGSGWVWSCDLYRTAEHFSDVIVCACTPFGSPPENWRPE